MMPTVASRRRRVPGSMLGKTALLGFILFRNWCVSVILRMMVIISSLWRTCFTTSPIQIKALGSTARLLGRNIAKWKSTWAPMWYMNRLYRTNPSPYVATSTRLRSQTFQLLPWQLGQAFSTLRTSSRIRNLICPWFSFRKKKVKYGENWSNWHLLRSIKTKTQPNQAKKMMSKQWETS